MMEDQLSGGAKEKGNYFWIYSNRRVDTQSTSSWVLTLPPFFLASRPHH